MDYQTILLLIVAGLVSLVLLVFAALILPARSFTQLAELIRYVGSLAEAQRQESQRHATLLSQEMAALRSSVQETGIRITQVNQRLDSLVDTTLVTEHPSISTELNSSA
jgi:hypothetical protein